jgi:hypothetical protein
MKDKINKHTRPSFNFPSGRVEYTPPAILCDEEMIENLSDKYHLYYVGISSDGITTLYPFYSEYERDVKWRALSIWGKYDEIIDKQQVEYRRKVHGDNFDRYYQISEKTYLISKENV